VTNAHGQRNAQNMRLYNMLKNLLYTAILLVLGASELSAQTPNPVGDATAIPLIENCFRVTENVQYQNGAVWYTEQLDLSEYFALNFEVLLGDQDEFGADGIVFVMQQVGTDALGNDGFGLGFSGFSPSFGVELDTFENFNAFDPDEDHMAMFRDGEVYHLGFTSLAPPVPIMPDGSDVENGTPFNFKLVWNPATQEIQAFVNCELRITRTIDLVNDVFLGDPLVYWGFTGSTGFYSNEQVVCFTELEYLHPTEEIDICLGDEVELSIATAEAENPEWSENVIDSNSLNPTVSPIENEEYVVTYEKCGEIFSDTTRVNVLVLSIDDVDSQSICNGEETDFEVISDPSLAVLWSNDSLEPSATYSDEGEHWVEVSNELCTRRKYFELDLIELPQIAISNEIEYCFNDSSLVSFSAPQSDLFLPSGDLGNEFYVSAETMYEVQAVDQVTGCQNYAFTQGVELPLPEIGFEEVYEICPYETLTLEVNPDYNVEWGNSSTANEQSFNEEGSYMVSAELDGCYSSHELYLQVNPIPVTSVPGYYEFCEDTELTLNSDNEGYDFQWPTGEVSSSFSFDQEGLFYVQVTDQITGCQLIDQVETVMILNPTIEMEEEYEFCQGDNITISPSVENADSIIWSNGFIGEEYEFYSSEELTVSAVNECLSVPFETEIKGILCDCIAYAPLAFTPDNDGLNETFLPVLRCEPFEYELLIFNRWGEIIFKSNDPSEGWSGNASSGEHFVSPGTYKYKLSYKAELFDGIHAKTNYGMVSVIR